MAHQGAHLLRDQNAKSAAQRCYDTRHQPGTIWRRNCDGDLDQVMIDPAIVRTRHRQCCSNNCVWRLCGNAGQELRRRPRRKQHRPGVLIDLLRRRGREETCPVQRAYPSRGRPVEEMLRNRLGVRKLLTEHVGMHIRRLGRCQQIFKPLEDLKVVDLEALQDRIENLLNLVNVADELIVERPRFLQCTAMCAGRQVVRVILAREPEPELGHQVVLRNPEFGQDRPDLCLVPVRLTKCISARWLQDQPHGTLNLAQQMGNQVSRRRPSRPFGHQPAGISEESCRARANLGEQSLSYPLLARR